MNEFFERLEKNKSPKFYRHYPNLFVDYFNGATLAQTESLSKAGYFYYHSLLNLDSVMDDGSTEEVPLMLTLQEESIKILSSIFDYTSLFWEYWNQRKSEYFDAVKIEKTLCLEEDISFDIYGDLADKKSAFGKVAIDSLYLLSHEVKEDIHMRLLESHKYFSIGFQLYDDVKDFKEDLEKGQFNFAVFSLKKAIDFDRYKNDADTLNKLLFIKGIGQEVLKKSIDQFGKALRVLKNLKKQSAWKETVLQMKTTLESYLEITNGYIETLKAKQALKYESNGNKEFFDYASIEEFSMKKGLDFVKSDFLQNYAELKHAMYLGDYEGFNNKTSLHISDTFQRAMLNDCLAFIASKHSIDATAFLENECNYIIERRNKDGIGAWSYFPTVQEIAADIDDLGQIMQMFLVSGNTQLIDRYCRKAIHIALNERMLDNGGIETWIIPKQNQSAIQKRQEYFNETKWGKGPDVEVVANFLYALALYEQKDYVVTIECSIPFILSQQHESGFWESRWYYGNYYGTYVCLRLLKWFEDKYQREIQRALDYLISCQNNDGGFSLNTDVESDPLSSAMALLCLKLFLRPGHNSSIKKAIDYLCSLQNEDGSWDGVTFIRPKVHEPYKSRTLTTAFVLKALC